MDIADLYGFEDRHSFYLARAERCREAAREARHGDLAATYLDLAEQWEDLARLMEKDFAERKTRPSG